jgi:hypothetical protein
MVFREDINPNAAQKLLKIFMDAELHYQLNGTPHSEFLERQAKKHIGQARRIITQVAALGPGAGAWVGYFIEGMNDGE